MISFDDVSMIYPNSVKALDGITLSIKQGEFVSIIGLSGAGKSTLLKSVNRMVDITRGRVLVENVDVSKLRGKELRHFRRKIGMIFQSFNLVDRARVINNVLTVFVPELSFFRSVFGIFTKEQKIKALEALDSMGILDKAYERVDHLSGGEKQRVALARTLTQKPTIILADEPIASLDPVNSRQVLSDIKRINKEENITVLMNIHDVELALEYADRIIGMKNGRIVYDKNVECVDKNELALVFGDNRE